MLDRSGQREEVVSDFLQGGPKSEEWRLWREALERRRSALRQERADLKEGADPGALDEKIEEIEEQINALATEEIISEFVESEVDISLNTIDEDEFDM
jgi:hypothetical protein